jgi:SulP family sulfate permease
MKDFIPVLFNFPKKHNAATEILSGITVALALVPEAIAFAMIAGFSPITGLYAAFIMGFVTSILGGRPGMISGATGAVAVVFVGLTLALKERFPGIETEQMMQYVFATVIFAGLLQVAAGLLKLGKFVRLVPQPVMYGFVNGLAIIIFMAQFPSFSLTSSQTGFYIMLGLVVLTMLIIWLMPKLTRAVPASLTAIIVVSALVIVFNIPTITVADTLAPGTHISGGFPPLSIPQIDFNLDTILFLLPYAAIMAGVGLIESLLTLNLIDEITSSRGRSNKECVAQGVANITSGFLSGMGGCAMIGQSLINITAGARARISGIVASLLLMCFVLFGSSVIEKMPMAALVGVMFMVAIGTFEWASFKIFRKMPWSDVVVMLIVTLTTAITHNLAVAVLIGIVLSALTYSWESAKHIRAKSFIDDKGVKHYHLSGPLFFGSTKMFNDLFDVKKDPQIIIVDFKESRIADMSAISSLNDLTQRYMQEGKEIRLRHLSKDCCILLSNAKAIIDVNVMEDPTYKVVTNKTKILER